MSYQQIIILACIGLGAIMILAMSIISKRIEKNSSIADGMDPEVFYMLTKKRKV